MDIDLTTLVADTLGISPAQLGIVLLHFVIAGPIVSALRPYVERVLVGWRDAALLTRTLADDRAVRALALAWSLVLWLPVAALRLVPIFTKAVDAARPPPESATEAALRRVAAAQPRPPGAGLGLLLCGLMLTSALVTTLMGCGPTQAQALHSGLDETTDLVDPGYAQAVVECDLSEREVIASHAPDEGAAAAVALAVVRVRCDVAYASFEAVRGAQLALRATADAMEDGRATATDVLRSLDELAAAVEASRAFVDAIRAARGTP